MDLAIIQQVVRELNGLLPGGFINKIHQPLPREIVLRIRLQGGGGVQVVLSADPQLGRIHLTTLRIPNPPTPPRLCAYLRAHFQGSRIVEVNVASDDRVVRIVTVRGPTSDIQERELVLEILGRDSNIILLDRSSYQIMECLHRIPEKEHGTRVVLPGMHYAPPPKRASRDLFKAHGALPKAISPGIRIGPGNKRRLVLDAVQPEDERFTTMNEAADAFYAARLTSVMLSALRREAATPVKSRIRSLARRIGKIEADATRLKNFESLQEDGELLKANLRSAKKGMETLTVYDWNTDRQRVLKLDPTLGPVANMERLFKRAAKGKRGRKIVEARLEETQAEKRALEEIVFFVEEAQDTDELERTAQWGSSLLRGRQPSQQEKRSKEASSESSLYREMRTPSGRSVFVGKSGKGNDFLIRRKARKGDIWFHVKGMPGAHVLLPERSKDPASMEDLEYAAALAVEYSRARGGSKVEVMMADTADLARPKGGLPGQVIVKSYTTLVSQGLNQSGHIAEQS